MPASHILPSNLRDEPICQHCSVILVWSNYDPTGGCYYCPNCLYYSDQPHWDDLLDAQIRILESLSCIPA